jgi:hypothetical protein
MREGMTEYEFVVRAIKKLRSPPYKGIHSAYSGFNEAFNNYFSKDPVEATTRLADEGKIATRPVKGGVLIWLPEEAPRSVQIRNLERRALKKLRGKGTSTSVRSRNVLDEIFGEDAPTSAQSTNVLKEIFEEDEPKE